MCALTAGPVDCSCPSDFEFCGVNLQESLRVVRLTSVRRDTSLVTENEDVRRLAGLFLC